MCTAISASFNKLNLYNNVTSGVPLMTMPDKVPFLCSCPDYLNGTKKYSKKTSTCKQCKGSRIAFTPIGGTVRMISSPFNLFDSSKASAAATVRRNCVGTVRLPSTSASSSSAFAQKNRPTILLLNGETDPYDFIRQSRLLYADKKITLDLNDTLRNRAKNIATVRTTYRYPNSGNNSTNNSSSTTYNHNLVNRTVTERSLSKNLSHFDGLRNRSSILHCTVNPYELISTTLHNNEFSPSGQLYDLSRSTALQNGYHSSTIEKIKLQNGTKHPRPLKALVDAKNGIPDGSATLPAKKPSLANQSTFKSILKSSPTAETTNSVNPDKVSDPNKTIKLPTELSTKENAIERKLSSYYSCSDNNKLGITNCQPKDQQIKYRTVNSKRLSIPSPESQTVRYKKVQFTTELEDLFNEGNRRLFKEKDSKIPIATSKLDAVDSMDRKGRQSAVDRSSKDRNLEEKVKEDSESSTESGGRSDKKRVRPKKNLQRSLSDRRLPDIKDDINFKDTTALRTKPSRSSPDQIFSKSTTNLLRPSEPPPKLPDNVRSNIPQRPPRQNKRNHVMDKIKQDLRKPDSDEAKVSRIFGLLPVSTINKATIKIAPTGLESKQEISLLKVANNLKNTNYQSYEKTSVAINGDDCYSTINVNDNIPVYQSSVVINSDTSPDQRWDSNAIHVESTNQIALYENERYNKLNDKQNGSVSVSVKIIDTKQMEIEKSMNSLVKPVKTLINLDYKDKEDNETSMDSQLCTSIKSDSSDCETSNNTKNTVLCSHGAVRSFPDSVILSLLNDPILGHLLQGLETKSIAKIIENSLVRLRANKTFMRKCATNDEEELNNLVVTTLHSIIKEERAKVEKQQLQNKEDHHSSDDGFSSSNYEAVQFDNKSHSNKKKKSNCCSKSPMRLSHDGSITASKFYQMLVDSSFWQQNESSTVLANESHHYETICLNCDPIYEEINDDQPPPLPLNPPPNELESRNKNPKSMFLGASKYDILSYLADAKERGVVPEDTFAFNFINTKDDNGKIISKAKRLPIIEREKQQPKEKFQTIDDGSLKIRRQQKCMANVERNDSGVGSETSKTSRNKYQPSPTGEVINKNNPIHLCEDCDEPIDTQSMNSQVIYSPIVCRKCGKKRAERKEILSEIIETEEKYGRDLQIIYEEFYQPMLVAGLLTQEQLSAIFLNIEELLENSQSLCEKMRDAFDIAVEQGDDDLFTVDIGKIMLDAAPMLCAFEKYCVRQAAASLLLANLEKDKELLRIFLRVSQMENTVLRRMNLNSFLMVPVQRVTKYPLLLARLYKVTPTHLECRERLKESQEKIEDHLNHMNREAKDISTKLWRRLSSNPTLRTTRESDIINIKLRKIAVDFLEWNHDKVHFAIEGKLLFTQPTDNNWRKGRTIKLTTVNGLLITNEAANQNTNKIDKFLNGQINFPKHNGFKEAVLLLVREKSGRYSLHRDPLYLDRCVVCTESDWAEYFEVHEISSKDSFIFKAEDDVRTKHWYAQLQYHAQGIGAWRKRRTALANIMINGMMLRP